MSRDPAAVPLRRCLLVWLFGSLGACLVVGLVLADLRDAWTVASTETLGTLAFDRLLVWLCEALVVVCAAWLWAAAGLVALDACRGRSRQHVGVPDRLRRLVLAACGVALIGGLAAPAHADSGGDAALVQGLPLPDRATAAMHVSLLLTRHVAVTEEPRTVVVHPGDTLWGLARASLPRDPSAVEIDERWHRIYRVNRAAIGADPDLIRPGQRLRMPGR